MSHYIANQIVSSLLQGVKDDEGLVQLMKKRGVTFELLQAEHPVMRAPEFAGLLRDCYEYFDDESIGFTQNPLRTGTFRMMCHASLGCQNIRRALLRIADYFRIVSDEFELTLEEQGEEARFVFGFDSKKEPAGSFFIVSMRVIVWRYLSWLMDAPMLLNRVYFKGGDESWGASLGPVFECPLYFSQEHDSMVFSSHYLSKPIKQTAESLSQFLADAPECLMSHFEPSQSISAQVKARLVESEEFDDTTLESMAKVFSCSSQSLARKLRNEGHQFQQLKDKVRKGKTINLLLNSDLPISAISQQLGFSEEAVFYRTFKKWTGATPNAYRQSHRR